VKLSDTLEELRAKVKAAREEFDLAVVFHEAWKPAAYDQDLHRRMSHCYAGNVFLVVRTALRREMLLALMRLWDKRPDAIKMDFIRATIANKYIVEALASERAVRIGLPEEVSQVKKELALKATAALALIDKYSKRGAKWSVRHRLQSFRHERLAHRQTRPATVPPPDPFDMEIEAFYLDMSELIRLLLGLVMAEATDPKDLGEVFGIYAKLFWAGVLGEHTEGLHAASDEGPPTSLSPTKFIRTRRAFRPCFRRKYRCAIRLANW
jgi:hypothetical protein